MDALKALVLGLLLCGPALASPNQLKEGNRLFKNGSYDKALKRYEDALVDTPYSNELKYNAGAAAYQAGDFAKAENYFKEAEGTAPPALKNAARYNRGNALFRQERLPDAIEAYKNALRLNPGDEDARYNLSVALRRQQQSSKGGGGKPTPKDKSGGKQDDKKNQGPGDQQNAPKPGEMSREDAERLLSAASAGEMKKGNQRQAKQEAPKVDEDW